MTNSGSHKKLTIYKNTPQNNNSVWSSDGKALDHYEYLEKVLIKLGLAKSDTLWGGYGLLLKKKKFKTGGTW